MDIAGLLEKSSLLTQSGKKQSPVQKSQVESGILDLEENQLEPKDSVELSSQATLPDSETTPPSEPKNQVLGQDLLALAKRLYKRGHSNQNMHPSHIRLSLIHISEPTRPY